MNYHKLTLCVLLIATMYAQVCLAGPAKECSEKLSTDLVIVLAEKFPNFRVPQLSDLDRQSIDFDIENGGDGCFAAVSGQFDGLRKEDSAVLLVPIKGRVPQLIVALKRDAGWKIDALPTFCEDSAFCYVKTDKPGTYVRSEALDTPPNRSGEMSRVTSKNMVVVSGRLESTGIVYVYSKGKWRYVWVSD